jgi:hypothetical protein
MSKVLKANFLEFFFFKVGTVKIEFGTYGHWGIEQ